MRTLIDHRGRAGASTASGLSRRRLLGASALVAAGTLVGPGPSMAARRTDHSGARFPYFLSRGVSSVNVTLTDQFWRPRQQALRPVTVPWATAHYDLAGGTGGNRPEPGGYRSRIQQDDIEAIKFIESMAAVAGLGNDPTLDRVASGWAAQLLASQDADGYFGFGWSAARSMGRWTPYWWSHEDYALGHFIEAGIALRDSTGHQSLYQGALRGANNMAATLLAGNRSYTSGHPEIEQALMRLFGTTGDQRYLKLCGWLIAQRGHHQDRPSFGRYAQDHLPVEHQRTIEGHAVRAAFLFNGVTEYVGATGHAGYREAVLAVWNDLVDHRMFIHGGSGSKQAGNEGYPVERDVLPPWDCYGESCSVVGNIRWAHNLTRLTGEARFLDTAERMLYNAFYASLSLAGDSFFYENTAQSNVPVTRNQWHSVPCCPPNIVTLFATIGSYLYDVDDAGVFIKHYAASNAVIDFARGVRIRQNTDYPWDGRIVVNIDPVDPIEFRLRLRIPAWTSAPELLLNGLPYAAQSDRGWLVIDRKWHAGDKVELTLPMHVLRVKAPRHFAGYENLVALQRGPIIYCLEEQDIGSFFGDIHLPPTTPVDVEHRPDLLGGVTVLKTVLLRAARDGRERNEPATLVPYGVWANRKPGLMKIWIADKAQSHGLPSKEDYLKIFPSSPPGATSA